MQKQKMVSISYKIAIHIASMYESSVLLDEFNFKNFVLTDFSKKCVAWITNNKTNIRNRHERFVLISCHSKGGTKVSQSTLLFDQNTIFRWKILIESPERGEWLDLILKINAI